MVLLEGIVGAVEFPPGRDWLNVDGPLTLAALRGKVVLLEFWTSSCIDCLHLLSDLTRLQAKYPRELVVIGVHSPKFPAEADTHSIRQAILHHEIDHPVVNDAEMIMWRQNSVRAWPTLVLIDPVGMVVGYHSGEGAFDTFDSVIGAVVRTFAARRLLDHRLLKLKLERSRASRTLLSFPGKILADERTDQLFVSDCGHHRVLVVSPADGAILATVGSGQPGLEDGDFATATFNHPQGMAFDGRGLYVADTGNHAIRWVDLVSGTVATVAGTGSQARRFSPPALALKTALNSPWDLALAGGRLFVAMAGSHQIWRFDPQAGIIEPHCGSGQEGRLDGPQAEASLAQPSGITTDGRRIYFVDSETGAIRAMGVSPGGAVETIAGGDVFDFGDQDGQGPLARFQHPVGVVWHDGALYVADTYNNKIKRIDLADGQVRTLLGTGRRGMEDGEAASFDQPCGLGVAPSQGKLYIADTNNHVIREADLAWLTSHKGAGRRPGVRTLHLKEKAGLEVALVTAYQTPTVHLPQQMVSPGRVSLVVDVKYPPGYKLATEAPVSLALRSSRAKVLSVNGQPAGVITEPAFPVRLELETAAGQAELRLDLALYWCSAAADPGCFLKEAHLALPVGVAEGAPRKKLTVTFNLAASYELAPAKAQSRWDQPKIAGKPAAEQSSPPTAGLDI